MLKSRAMTGGSDKTLGDLFGPTLPTGDDDAGDATPRVPCLTIAYHPDLRRAGQVAQLTKLVAGGAVELSRVAPEFRDDDSARVGPIADPFVSRRCAKLELAGQRVRLTVEPGAKVLVDGDDVPRAIDLWPSDVERGVVVELGGRVVLVLHMIDPGRRYGPALGLIGRADVIEDVRRHVLELANLDVPVLLRGETGTGKELIAKAVHDTSARAHQPFVAANVSAIPATTAASELFGHVQGAFSGATGDHAGYFGAADGGTLFLDEIGEAPAEIQTMLLRALESGVIQPVGAASERQTDVRIIAATDADLEQAVASGAFRGPLLHRLVGTEVALPPLRARRVDIGRLLCHFLLEHLLASGDTGPADAQVGSPTLWLPTPLVRRLLLHDWPGNVRQLRNAARHIVVANRKRARVVTDATLERFLAPAVATSEAPSPSAPNVDADLKSRVEDYEAALILDGLRAAKWNKPEAARMLKLPYRTLVHKVRKLGIPDEPDDE